MKKQLTKEQLKIYSIEATKLIFGLRDILGEEVVALMLRYLRFLVNG